MFGMKFWKWLNLPTIIHGKNPLKQPCFFFSFFVEVWSTSYNTCEHEGQRLSSPGYERLHLVYGHVICEATQQWQKSNANTKLCDVLYNVGFEFFLSTSNIKLKPPYAIASSMDCSI